ncbi:MAG TPA: glycoside hydrolase family 44 protein, partial [Anaerohalosphaeraceae bacterium]|nr:glycoside hydrolase family 44 protein [Anaerohalosphaeraceae bacterium]
GWCISPVQADISVTYTIDTQQDVSPISPYIYGYNFEQVSAQNLTVRRMGGNRLTGYNWETNFSNAGSDWQHSSDEYMSSYIPSAQRQTPGKVITDFVDANLAAGRASLITLQMAGYVAADKNGTVTESQAAPSTRWKEVVYQKTTPFCSPAGSPDKTDNAVYMDELVNYLVTRYGSASSTSGVRFYALDNEPALWSSTHPRIHPLKPTCVELLNKSIALASAVKDVDPDAQICGPVLYGFAAFNTFQDAVDWSTVKSGRSYSWFIDYYLDTMKQASTAQNRRLLDVLDLHWYPEAQGDGSRICDTQPPYSQANAEARMQAPRTLWDQGYYENSWIGTWFKWALPLLPKITQSINTYYPGTKLAFTEYNYGAGDHISGGIATADVLGIFGKYGVYLSTYWGSNRAYVNSAFSLFRNYDGANSAFGDTRVRAAMTDKVNSSIYGSTCLSDRNELHLIVLNKNYTQSINGSFTITAPQFFTSARVWAFDSASSAVTERAPVSAISGNAFSYAIPPLTACHFVIRSDRPTGDLSGNCEVGIEDLDLFADQWLDIAGCSGIDCGDFNNDTQINLLDMAILAQNWMMGAACQ